jgi:hypothetical protein
MWALTVLSFDSDLSRYNQKTTWLIEMHQMLLQALTNQFKAEEATEEENDSIALYFEHLARLPEKTRETILGEMPLPKVKSMRSSQASPSNKRISEGLRRKFTENKKDFIIVDEESGLDSGILPMDITIKEGVENRIIAFIELDGPDHFVTREDGQRVAHRRDQLKEELYKFNHPRIPLLRIDLLDNRPYERHVEELYEKITVSNTERNTPVKENDNLQNLFNDYENLLKK